MNKKIFEKDLGKHNNATTGFKALAKKTGGGEKGARIAGAQLAKMRAKGQVESNGEYDDEVGMVENNLHTIARCAQQLEGILSSNENLPEWVEEKISIAKQNMVTVLDYMASEEELGHEQTMSEHKKGVKAMKYTSKPRNFVAKNATTSGAGAHTDKKKAAIKNPRKAKHKKNPDTLDMVGEGKNKKTNTSESWYYHRLNTILESKLK